MQEEYLKDIMNTNSTYSYSFLLYSFKKYNNNTILIYF